MILRLVALLAATLLLCPSEAAPQDEEDPRTTAWMNMGPFYLTPRVTLSNLGVDTNVFNQSVEPESDFTFTLAPAVDVWVPFARRALLEVSTTVGMTYYHQFASERSIDPGVRGRLEVYLTRLTLSGGGTYLNTRERASYEIDARSRRVEDGYDGGAEIRIYGKVYLEAAGRHLRYRFDSDEVFEGTSLQQTLNRDSDTVSATIRYRWTPLTTIEVRGESIVDRFVYSPARDTDSFRVMGGARFRPRAVLNGAGFVGVRRFTPLSDTLPPYQGLVAQAELSYTLLGATLFRFNALRDVEYSYEVEQPYYLNDTYGLTISRHVGGQWDTSLGAARSQSSYRDFFTSVTPAVTDGQSGRVDVTWNYTGSLTYRVSRDGRIGVGVSYYDRTSNVKAYRDYSGLRAGLVASFGS